MKMTLVRDTKNFTFDTVRQIIIIYKGIKDIVIRDGYAVRCRYGHGFGGWQVESGGEWYDLNKAIAKSLSKFVVDTKQHSTYFDYLKIDIGTFYKNK